MGWVPQSLKNPTNHAGQTRGNKNPPNPYRLLHGQFGYIEVQILPDRVSYVTSHLFGFPCDLNAWPCDKHLLLSPMLAQSF